MSVSCQRSQRGPPILDARHRVRCLNALGTPRCVGTASAEEPANGLEPYESRLHTKTSAFEAVVFYEGFQPASGG